MTGWQKVNNKCGNEDEPQKCAESHVDDNNVMIEEKDQCFE